MKRIALLTALAATTVATTARADVSWEHKATIRISSLPLSLANLKMYTNYGQDRARVLVKYTIPLMPSSAIPPSTWKGSGVPPQLQLKRVSNAGSFGLVQRIDDDRLVAYDSQTGAYVDESLSGTMRRLIGDPFKTTDPALSAEETPELTEAQRRRLGREIRAYIQPATKRFSRTYFRALPQTRTFGGIEGRGFRLVQKFLVPKSMGGGPNDSMQIAFEWWLAGDLPGDEMIRGAQMRAMEKMKAIGYPSKSMWAAETNRVLVYALPEAALDAIRTLAPGPGFSGFGGTPLQMDMTIAPSMGMGVTDNVRASVSLVSRNTYELPARVWDAPADYKKVDLAPLWKQYDIMREKGTLEGIFQEIEKQEKERKTTSYDF